MIKVNKFVVVFLVIIVVSIIIFMVTSAPQPTVTNNKQKSQSTIKQEEQETTKTSDDNQLIQETVPVVPVVPVVTPVVTQTAVTPVVAPVTPESPQVTPTVPKEFSPAVSSGTSPQTQVQSKPIREYVFYQGLDSGGNDIRQDTNKDDIEKLKEQCDNEEKCIGFNTNGWLKFILNPFSKWTKWTDEPNKGFYRVKTAEIPPGPTIVPFKKECTYVQSNGLSWNGMGYDATEVKKIDSATAADKAKYCEVAGHCFNPSTGGAWCFKPTNGYPENEYIQTIQNGVWASDGFKCEGAIGRNITGNNGDYANYCMFNELSDAQNYCSQDPACKGILGGNGAFVATRANPIVNNVANGSFYRKPGAQVKLL